MTKKKFPHFESDFGWDNFDAAIPKGIERHQFKALQRHERFITYGSFFGSEDASNHMEDLLELKQPLPEEVSKASRLFSKHAVFTLVQQSIAKLPIQRVKTVIRWPKKAIDKVVYKESNDTASAMLAVEEEAVAIDEERPFSIMVLNDGISPISSSLWLGRFDEDNFKTSKNPVKAMWLALKDLKGSGKARLFPAMDHLDWMKGTNRTESETVQDILNPDEPPKTAFDWFIYDLTSES